MKQKIKSFTDDNTANRKSIRLKNYDYSNAGYYYVTICIQNRQCLFGDIENETMILNGAGKMTDYWWQKLPEKFPNIKLGKYQIMPNHLHGIIIINNLGRTHGSAPTENNIVGVDPRVDPDNKLPTLGKIIQWFKTMTTNEYIREVKQNGWDKFDRRLWQRNYWEHILRTEHDLSNIQKYLEDNPRTWHRDRNNPNNIKK